MMSTTKFILSGTIEASSKTDTYIIGYYDGSYYVQSKNGLQTIEPIRFIHDAIGYVKERIKQDNIEYRQQTKH